VTLSSKFVKESLRVFDEPYLTSGLASDSERASQAVTHQQTWNDTP